MLCRYLSNENYENILYSVLYKVFCYSDKILIEIWARIIFHRHYNNHVSEIVNIYEIDYIKCFVNT